MIQKQLTTCRLDILEIIGESMVNKLKLVMRGLKLPSRKNKGRGKIGRAWIAVNKRNIMTF